MLTDLNIIHNIKNFRRLEIRETVLNMKIIYEKYRVKIIFTAIWDIIFLGSGSQ